MLLKRTLRRHPEVVEVEDEPSLGFEEYIASNVSTNHAQLQNLVECFKTLYRYDFKRCLMVVNSEVAVHQSESNQMMITEAIRAIGFRAVVVDAMLSGKGREFAKFKAVFDSDDPTPIAMCCFTMSTQLLTGTNLDRVDSFLTVGNIPQKTITQSFGRIFRPLPTRDNTKPIPMMRIYS